MVDEQNLSDEEKNKKLAGGIRDLLIERIDLKTLNASEMKVAMELLEKLGYRYVSPSATKGGGLSKALPVFDEDMEGLVSELPQGVTLRRA